MTYYVEAKHDWVVVRIVLVLVVLLLAAIVIVLVGTVIALENRNPEKTVAWLIILAVFPIIGFILYLVLGRNARKHKLFHHKYIGGNRLKRIVSAQTKKLEAAEVYIGDRAVSKKRLMRLLLNNAHSPLSVNNRTDVLTNGDQMFPVLFDALEAAQDHIHLEYYIFKDDTIGKKVRDLLVRKANEGVEVRLIFDGLGSRELGEGFIESMQTAGIRVQMFFPLRFPFLTSKLNFRNHRKIVVVDGRVGFLGGMNIGDEYLSMDPELGFWRDTHLRLEGDCVHMIQTIFLNDWYFITREQLDDPRYFPRQEEIGRQLTQVVASGPDSDWESIREVFFTALATAERKIYMQTPYFVPDESIIMALKTAALSGLDVRLIVQGIPEYKITYYASRSYFGDLLKAGVKVYKYQKGILHAKVLLVDDQVGLVGSANLDIRSFQLNFEISALLYDRTFVERLEQDFLTDLANSVQVQPEEFARRPLSDRMKESGARLFSPLL